MKTTSRYTTAILLVALVGQIRVSSKMKAAICNAETLSISMLDEKCIVERLEDVADISGELIEKQRGVVSLELCVGYCKIPELRQRCNAVRYREEDGSCQLFRISETEYEDNYIEPDEGELYSVTSCQEEEEALASNEKFSEEIIVRLPGTNFNCTVNLVNHRKVRGYSYFKVLHDEESFHSCLAKCVTGRYKYKCTAADFVYDVSKCTLLRENPEAPPYRRTFPGHFGVLSVCM